MLMLTESNLSNIVQWNVLRNMRDGVSKHCTLRMTGDGMEIK
jgi:hypothetical protein